MYHSAVSDLGTWFAEAYLSEYLGLSWYLLTLLMRTLKWRLNCKDVQSYQVFTFFHCLDSTWYINCIQQLQVSRGIHQNISCFSPWKHVLWVSQWGSTNEYNIFSWRNIKNVWLITMPYLELWKLLKTLKSCWLHILIWVLVGHT